MDTGCINRVYSEDYQDYIVEYPGFPGFLERQFGNDCFHFVTNKYAIAYYSGKEVQSDVNGGAYIVPHCYGLMSSSQMLEETGVARVQRQPALSLYGNGVMIGFIDTGDGVCCKCHLYSARRIRLQASSKPDCGYVPGFYKGRVK